MCGLSNQLYELRNIFLAKLHYKPHDDGLLFLLKTWFGLSVFCNSCSKEEECQSELDIKEQAVSVMPPITSSLRTSQLGWSSKVHHHCRLWPRWFCYSLFPHLKMEEQYNLSFVKHRFMIEWRTLLLMRDPCTSATLKVCKKQCANFVARQVSCKILHCLLFNFSNCLPKRCMQLGLSTSSYISSSF